MARDTLFGVPSTPFLRVDVPRMEAIARIADAARAAGVVLRPHAKTHKSPEVGARQLAAGAVGLTVATIGEAQAFSAAGCEDIVIALPRWADDDRARRLRDLASRVRLKLAVDSAEGAAHLASRLTGAPVEVPSHNHSVVGVLEHVFEADAVHVVERFQAELHSSYFDARRLQL